MKISEIIASLERIKTITGDVEVYTGNYYMDRKVDEVVIEDGYPLIVSLDLW